MVPLGLDGLLKKNAIGGLNPVKHDPADQPKQKDPVNIFDGSKPGSVGHPQQRDPHRLDLIG